MHNYDGKTPEERKRIADEEIKRMNIELEEDYCLKARGLDFLRKIDSPLYLTELFRPKVRCQEFKGLVMN